MVGTDLAPFTKEIAGLAAAKVSADVRAARPEFIATPDPRKKMLIDGEKRTEVVVPPADRKYDAFGLDSIVGMAAYSQSVVKRERQAVLVSPKGVTLVFDEADRSERALFVMKKSEAFNRLKHLAIPEEDLEEDETHWMSQREVLDLLRVDFTGKVLPEDLISSLRQIKFSSDGKGESTVQTGKESIGKSVLAEMSGVSKIPEDVTIELAVYENVHFGGRLRMAQVECDLSTQVSGGTFRVKPKAGELVRVELDAMGAVRDYLQNALKSSGLGEVPVFLAEV